MADNSFDLTGRVAIVTGASRGLGQSLSQALARAGADLAITSRHLADLQSTAEGLKVFARKALPLECDVRDSESVRRMVEGVFSEYGRIDILVNNAGCNIRKRAVEVTWDDWNTILDTNLRGSFFTAQAAARHMIKARFGRIINIGSATCVAGYSGLAPYGASRGGIRQLTMSLAADWGEYGITVNCLAPGWFNTAQTAVMYEDQDWVAYLSERIPLGRPGSPRDLDGAVVFLASDTSQYITGQILMVDGGLSVGALRALPRK
jgi:NAD(P)-dependent dehydrogenase (short-subunit alcohol dehydrogenase family)